MSLFDRYPSSPDEIVGCAAALVVASGTVAGTVSDVRGQAAQAQQAVEGDLVIPLATAPDDVTSRGDAVAQSARYCAGVLTYFAGGVITFDAGIDRLNARWPSSSTSCDDTMSMGRTQVLAGLDREHALLEQVLDDKASESAAMLDRGPNDADVAALTQLGVMPTASPLDDPALATALHRLGLESLDGHGFGDLTSVQRREWWASLSVGERRAVIAAYPASIGSGDGLPAEARDEANRILLAGDLRDLETKEQAGTLTAAETRQLAGLHAIDSEINLIESRRDPLTNDALHAQLYIYDPAAFNGDGRAAVATGNLDDADHVAFTVPGLGTTTAGMTGNRALNVYNESRRAAPGDEIAVLDWVGYDAPSGGLDDDYIGVLNQDMARDGARLLASDVSAFQVSRGDDDVHLTVAGNSYGSSTSAIAADEFGLEADDLILTGSPGAGNADDANDLTTGRAHTWVGSASHDLVSTLGVTGWMDPSQVGASILGELGLPTDADLMGNDPSEDDFDAHRFQAENVDRIDGTHIDTGDPMQSSIDGWNVVDHGRYYDTDTESLYNVASVVTGQYDDVVDADHRYDPWYTSMQDPERDRDPVAMDHEG